MILPSSTGQLLVQSSLYQSDVVPPKELASDNIQIDASGTKESIALDLYAKLDQVTLADARTKRAKKVKSLVEKALATPLNSIREIDYALWLLGRASYVWERNEGLPPDVARHLGDLVRLYQIAWYSINKQTKADVRQSYFDFGEIHDEEDDRDNRVDD